MAVIFDGRMREYIGHLRLLCIAMLCLDYTVNVPDRLFDEHCASNQENAKPCRPAARKLVVEVSDGSICQKDRIEIYEGEEWNQLDKDKEFAPSSEVMRPTKKHQIGEQNAFEVDHVTARPEIVTSPIRCSERLLREHHSNKKNNQSLIQCVQLPQPEDLGANVLFSILSLYGKFLPSISKSQPNDHPKLSQFFF